MKKRLILILLLVFIFPSVTFAQEKQSVTLSACVDGDTAKFVANNEIIKVRFLAIDTPETKHPTKKEEPYGKEASDFTCNKLKTASKIELEYDSNSEKTDKYGRYLAWIFVDDNLLQVDLVKNGLAQVAYLYGDYKYTSLLKENEQTAKTNNVGMYSSTDTSEYTATKESELEKKATENAKNKVIKYFNKVLDKILEEIF